MSFLRRLYIYTHTTATTRRRSELRLGSAHPARKTKTKAFVVCLLPETKRNPNIPRFSARPKFPTRNETETKYSTFSARRFTAFRCCCGTERPFLAKQMEERECSNCTPHGPSNAASALKKWTMVPFPLTSRPCEMFHSFTRGPHNQKPAHPPTLCSLILPPPAIVTLRSPSSLSPSSKPKNSYRKNTPILSYCTLD